VDNKDLTPHNVNLEGNKEWEMAQDRDVNIVGLWIIVPQRILSHRPKEVAPAVRVRVVLPLAEPPGAFLSTVAAW
jgi:hypothetical protein